MFLPLHPVKRFPSFLQLCLIMPLETICKIGSVRSVTVLERKNPQVLHISLSGVPVQLIPNHRKICSSAESFHYPSPPVLCQVQKQEI